MSRLTSTQSQGIDAPTRKVVGFHVEGASPSPSNNDMIKNAIKSGSLSPVIIPPSFQVRVGRDHGRTLEPCFHFF